LKRKITEIVIHCSAYPNGSDKTIEAMNSDHKARKFKRNSQYVRSFNPDLKYVGYHRYICFNGKVQTGRHLEEIGAHVAGYNSNTIGVCMAGTDKFSKEQFASLKEEIYSLLAIITSKTVEAVKAIPLQDFLKQYSLKIKGHRDYSPDLNKDGKITSNEFIKICPGFDVSVLVKRNFEPLEQWLKQ
jgi:hypothetical protein